MSTVKARILAWKRALLCFCSKSYREHDAALSELADLRKRANDLESANAELRDRLKLAISAQESAAQQLIAERSLRQRAEELADKYHGELTDALKSNVDWLARGLYHRRPMFGVGAPPDEPAAQGGDPKPLLRDKPMARAVAQKQTHEAFAELLKDIKEGHIPAEPQVGPEYATQ